MPVAFDDFDRFGEVGGFQPLNEQLALPMVLVMSIWNDVSPPPFPRPLSRESLSGATD